MVFLKGAASQDPATLIAMRQEVKRLLDPSGYGVEFRTELGTAPVSGRFVVTELKGECTTGAADNSPERRDLATTAVANGHILPFSEVNCAVVSRLLSATLWNAPVEMRKSLFGRSLGRIVAHELFHILADERGHESAGVAKSHFSADDLLNAHFSFESGALERMAQHFAVVEIPRRAATD